MRKQTKLWTIKGGKKIRICDMTDDHLINTLRLLKWFAIHTQREAIKAGDFMLHFLQGVMAIESVEDGLDTLMQEGAWEDLLPDIFWNLHDDLIRRGLTYGEE